ncbi:hypothetical protein ACFONC_15205 [Luteimonas soli]|uniref:STAS/SEC14 domain-containing protein n=1 Tax=Luteimonas soli TaxID=1648966 RepID=A0ABV7XP23_9GAMM
MAASNDRYRLEITPHGSGLRAHVAGESSLDTTLAYWRAIAREARECGAASLLLVDEMIGEPLGESDWLTLVASMQGEGLEKLRIAHAKPLGLQQVEFCEIFARDAGIEAKVFESESLADIWLQYGER